ncbi:MAG TPA: hypothetical protein VLF20_01605 [Patescibacteria group bacterium]|nr:hypothetical protein [Patescibacteria group bacterium]
MREIRRENPRPFLQTHPDQQINMDLQACLLRASGMLNFPFGKCNQTTDIIIAVLESRGFRPVYGYFHLDKPDRGKTKKVHTWATDAQARFIDLTGNQFNEFLNDGDKFPAGVVIIEENDPRRTRYQPFRTKPVALPQ